jgi:hypothetical protein
MRKTAGSGYGCRQRVKTMEDPGQLGARNERRTKDLREQIEQARPIQLHRPGPEWASMRPPVGRRGRFHWPHQPRPALALILA